MDNNEEYTGLARWLEQVLCTPERAETASSSQSDDGMQLLLHDDYHLRFYQQLPDFVMALLDNDPMATIRYAPLFYHLVSCRQCHKGYLELYDAMRFAVQPRQGPRPTLGQGTRTLAATPPRMLSHFCQTLISQAEAMLRQARHDHTDASAAARALLQLAIHISSHINQSAVRREALQNLVHVATLFDGPDAPKEEDATVRSYTPILSGAGGMRRGKKIMRRADNLSSQGHPVIHLQSRGLEGRIIQRGRVLELHLQDLDPSLRGRFVTISVLLGSLFEPVNWVGGNPREIHSLVPVDASGSLVTPLGETELQLDDPEEHNLLETMFMLLEVR